MCCRGKKGLLVLLLLLLLRRASVMAIVVRVGRPRKQGLLLLLLHLLNVSTSSSALGWVSCCGRMGASQCVGPRHPGCSSAVVQAQLPSGLGPHSNKLLCWITIM